MESQLRRNFLPGFADPYELCQFLSHVFQPVALSNRLSLRSQSSKAKRQRRLRRVDAAKYHRILTTHHLGEAQQSKFSKIITNVDTNFWFKLKQTDSTFSCFDQNRTFINCKHLPRFHVFRDFQYDVCFPHFNMLAFVAKMRANIRPSQSTHKIMDAFS